MLLQGSNQSYVRHTAEKHEDYIADVLGHIQTAEIEKLVVVRFIEYPRCLFLSCPTSMVIPLGHQKAEWAHIRRVGIYIHAGCFESDPLYFICSLGYSHIKDGVFPWKAVYYDGNVNRYVSKAGWMIPSYNICLSFSSWAYCTVPNITQTLFKCQ